MRRYIEVFITKYFNLFLHVILTVTLCVICSENLGPASDYTFIANIIFLLCIIYYIYRIIFKKIYKNSVFKILCVFALIIASNHLYSYKNLLTLFPWISNKHIVTAGIIAVFLIFIIMFFLISLSNTNQNQPPVSNNNHHNTIAPSQSSTSNPNCSNSNTNLLNHNSAFSILCVFIFIVLVVSLSILLYFKLGLPSIISDKKSIDLSLFVSAIIGHSASILFLIFAIVIITLALIELVKFLYQRILLFYDDIKNKNTNKNLSYIFSVLIVFAMVFLTFKISDISMDDFTDIASAGDYLALPLIVLLGIVAIILLIRLTHGVLLLVMKSEPINIQGFVTEAGKELKLKQHIVTIAKSLTNIIIGTIESALSFVEFIPDFFQSLKIMVLDEEDENIQSNENTQQNENIQQNNNQDNN